MDRGAWWATVHGLTKELDTIEQLNCNNNIRLIHFFQLWQMVVLFFWLQRNRYGSMACNEILPFDPQRPCLAGPNLRRLRSLSMKSKEPSRSEEPEPCLVAFVISPGGSRSCQYTGIMGELG